MSRSRFVRRQLFRVLLAAGLAGPAVVAHAQEPAPESAAAAAAETETIPLAEVTDRAEAVVAELATALPDDTAREDLRVIEDRTQQLTADVTSRVAGAEAALTGTANLRRLRELELQLGTLETALEGPNQELDEILRKLTASIEQLDGKSALWKRTRDEARSRGAAASTLERIIATRRAIDRARRELVTYRNEVLAVRDKLVEPRANLVRAIKQVRDAIKLRIEEVFFVDAPPIWNSAVRASLRGELQQGWYEPIANSIDRARAYASERKQLIFFQLALFVALALGLRMVRTGAKERADENYDLREARRVFEFPNSMALLIALGFTPQLHPLAPHFFFRAVMAATVVPVVLIARRLAPPALGPLVFGMAAFFLVDRVRDVIETLPTLERVVAVTEFVAAIAFVLWLRRPSRFAKIPSDMLREPFLRVVDVAMRVVVVLLGIALVAESVGLGNLADLIGNGTLRGAYAALFLFALLKVFQSLVAYALVLKPLRLLYLVSRYRWLVRQHADRALRIGAILLWSYVTISLMGFHSTLISILGALLGATLDVGAASVSLGDVVVFGITLWLSFLLARFVNFVLNEDVYPRVRLARGVPYAISSLVRYAIIFFGFMVALAAAGIELTKLTVIAGGLGVGIGFGLQTVVNNFVSGLILLFERPLQVGDAVELRSEDLRGEIRRIGIRASVLRTFDGAEVIVPNGRLISDSVTNWTLSDRRRRVELMLGVEYGTDARRVIELLLDIARAHPDVLADPEPTAFFLNFGDSALEFQLRVWISDFDERNRIRSELAIAIQQRLASERIGVPFPQRDLHLRSLSPRVASELGRAAGATDSPALGGDES